MVPAVPLLQLPPLLPLLQVQDSVVAIWTPPLEKWTIFQSAVSICLDPHIVWKLLKMSHLDLSILVFFTDFCLETLFDRKLHFQKIAKLTFFGISNELLSTQNVNVARFARNVEWNFLCDFQTPWSFLHTYSLFHFFPGRAYPFRVSVLTDENEVNIILKYLHDFHLQNHPFCFSNVVPPMKTCARMKLPLPLILVALLALLSIMSKPPVNLSSNL